MDKQILESTFEHVVKHEYHDATQHLVGLHFVSKNQFLLKGGAECCECNEVVVAPYMTCHYNMNEPGEIFICRNCAYQHLMLCMIAGGG